MLYTGSGILDVHDTLKGGVGKVGPDSDVVMSRRHVRREPVVLLSGLGCRGRHGERVSSDRAVPGVQEGCYTCEGKSFLVIVSLGAQRL